MPDECQDAVEIQPTTCDAAAQSNDFKDSPTTARDSTRTASKSTTETSDAFGSESSLEIDDASDTTSSSKEERLFWRRLSRAFGLYKRYPPGHEKGRVKQRVHSRKYCVPAEDTVLNVGFAVDEYAAGYGRVAAIQNLDSDFIMYRKFGWLRAYALLHLQDEIAELEEDLQRLDRWEFSDGNDLMLASRRNDYSRENGSRRKEIVGEVHRKLAQYGKLRYPSSVPIFEYDLILFQTKRSCERKGSRH